MLQCTNCERQQADGKFCGACGSPLEEVNTTETTVDARAHEEEDRTEERAEFSSEKGAEAGDMEQELSHPGHSSAAVKEQELAEQEVAAASMSATMSEDVGTPVVKTSRAPMTDSATVTASQAPAKETNPSSEPIRQSSDTSTGQAVDDDGVKRDYVEEAKKYWRYSLDVLKSPGKAFGHKEDKFVYSIINLVLYALTFSLIILSVVRGIYKRQFGGIGSMLGVDTTGMFVQMTVYLFIGMSVALLVVLLSILVAEKTMIKKMTFKEILVQYSGLLIPFIFLQVAVLLFSLIGSSFISILFVCISLFYGLFFLTAIFMYEKVTFYQSTPHKVYTAVGTIIFVALVFAIVTFVFGMSLIENIVEMIDDLTYYF